MNQVNLDLLSDTRTDTPPKDSWYYNNLHTINFIRVGNWDLSRNLEFFLADFLANNL